MIEALVDYTLRLDIIQLEHLMCRAPVSKKFDFLQGPGFYSWADFLGNVIIFVSPIAAVVDFPLVTR